LENKKNRIYAIILACSTILFIIGMTAVVFSLNFTASPNAVKHVVSGSSNSQSVKERLEYLDSYIEKHGPDVIYSELYYGHSYEPEFDSYWEFADIQVAGIRGRFADDNSKDKALIEEYIAGCNDPARKASAEKYLELME